MDTPGFSQLELIVAESTKRALIQEIHGALFAQDSDISARSPGRKAHRCALHGGVARARKREPQARDDHRLCNRNMTVENRL
jgi:hypothetical protein